MDDEKLKPLVARLDKHDEKFSKHDERFGDLEKKIDLSHWRHDQTEKMMRDQCKIMTETREEVISTFGARFDSQDTLLQQLLADKHRKEGEEAALLRTRKEDQEKLTIRIQILKSIPEILKVLTYVGMGYMALQQLIPHE